MKKKKALKILKYRKKGKEKKEKKKIEKNEKKNAKNLKVLKNKKKIKKEKKKIGKKKALKILKYRKIYIFLQFYHIIFLIFRGHEKLTSRSIPENYLEIVIFEYFSYSFFVSSTRISYSEQQKPKKQNRKITKLFSSKKIYIFTKISIFYNENETVNVLYFFA